MSSHRCLRRIPSSAGSNSTAASGRLPDALDFFIWTAEDVGAWLEGIGLAGYKEVFKENEVTGEYLDNLSTFTTEQILRFIRRCHMKWGDFITLCKELRRVKVACLEGEQQFRTPWWAPCCLSNIFTKFARHNRHSRVVSLKFDPWWSWPYFSMVVWVVHDSVWWGEAGQSIRSHCSCLLVMKLVAWAT